MTLPCYRMLANNAKTIPVLLKMIKIWFDRVKARNLKDELRNVIFTFSALNVESKRVVYLVRVTIFWYLHFGWIEKCDRVMGNLMWALFSPRHYKLEAEIASMTWKVNWDDVIEAGGSKGGRRGSRHSLYVSFFRTILLVF